MSGIIGISGQSEDGETYLFPKVEGESDEQVEAKIESGYVEIPGFAFSDLNYCCSSCEYFKTSEASSTGFVCVKYNFFDRQFGCCGGWELKPELRTYQVSDQ